MHTKISSVVIITEYSRIKLFVIYGSMSLPITIGIFLTMLSFTKTINKNIHIVFTFRSVFHILDSFETNLFFDIFDSIVM